MLAPKSYIYLFVVLAARPSVSRYSWKIVSIYSSVIDS
jgi:hypothetical protein